MTAPNAPNLYWALADLPRPFIPMRQAMEIERSMVFIQWPAVREAIAGKDSPTPEEWEQTYSDLGNPVLPLEREPALATTVLALKLYPEAKRYLLAHGRTRDEVEAMPVVQAIAIHNVEEYVKWRDDIFKWFGQPYWQVRDGLRRTCKAFGEWYAEDGRHNPFAALLPALDRAMFSQARLDRRLAALQTIEAVRIYAAAHEGRLPERLDLMTAAPAPIDPVTGKPFHYAVEGNRFVLDCPAPPGERADRGEKYIITLEK